MCGTEYLPAAVIFSPLRTRRSVRTGTAAFWARAEETPKVQLSSGGAYGLRHGGWQRRAGRTHEPKRNLKQVCWPDRFKLHRSVHQQFRPGRSLKVLAKLTDRVGSAIAAREKRISWIPLEAAVDQAAARWERPHNLELSAERAPVGQSRLISRCSEIRTTVSAIFPMCRSLPATDFGCTIIHTASPDPEVLPVLGHPLTGREQEAHRSPHRSWLAFKLW
jgi:hypothetical protein